MSLMGTFPGIPPLGATQSGDLTIWLSHHMRVSLNSLLSPDGFSILFLSDSQYQKINIQRYSNYLSRPLFQLVTSRNTYNDDNNYNMHIYGHYCLVSDFCNEIRNCLRKPKSRQLHRHSIKKPITNSCISSKGQVLNRLWE